MQISHFGFPNGFSRRAAKIKIGEMMFQVAHRLEPLPALPPELWPIQQSLCCPWALVPAAQTAADAHCAVSAGHHLCVGHADEQPRVCVQRTPNFPQRYRSYSAPQVNCFARILFLSTSTPSTLSLSLSPTLLSSLVSWRVI